MVWLGWLGVFVCVCARARARVCVCVVFVSLVSFLAGLLAVLSPRSTPRLSLRETNFRPACVRLLAPLGTECNQCCSCLACSPLPLCQRYCDENIDVYRGRS